MDNQNPKIYVCLGTCQTIITEEEYRSGLTKCRSKGCTLEGHPFIRGKKNPETGKTEASDA